MEWCCALAAFALTKTYGLALLCLFSAGFFELSFSRFCIESQGVESAACKRMSCQAPVDHVNPRLCACIESAHQRVLRFQVEGGAP